MDLAREGPQTLVWTSSKGDLSLDLGVLGMRHKYVSQAYLTHTQLRTNYKNKEPFSDALKCSDDQDDCENGEEYPWKCK